MLPSDKSAGGHFEDPKRPWQSLLNAANITDMRICDLRRTMGSWQAISGASLPVIGKSLGHKSTSATQVYSRLTVDPIRDSMQTATDKMLGVEFGIWAEYNINGINLRLNYDLRLHTDMVNYTGVFCC